MPERPLECARCQKPPDVIYKEALGGAITCSEMCKDCPVLEQKLYGKKESGSFMDPEYKGSLCCGECMTTSESVKTGMPLGCSNCYLVFGDLLLEELAAQNKLPPAFRKPGRSGGFQPIHIGKSPLNPTAYPPSARVASLSEALGEAVKKENYEEAASLRDRIKELLEKKNE